jgi:hypothetical protein
MKALTSIAGECSALVSSNERKLGAVLVRLSDVQPEPVKWTWHGWLPNGKLCILWGQAGVGKSYFLADLIARISTGRQSADKQPLELGSVLLLAGEDDASDTIRPRIDQLGGDPSKIVLLQGMLRGKKRYRVMLIDESHLAVMDQVGRDLGDLRLIIIDPLICYTTSVESNRGEAVRAVMDKLTDLARCLAVPVLVVMHEIKSTAGRRAGNLIPGSHQYEAAARSAFWLTENPKDRRLILMPGKMNLTEKPKPITFIIGENGPIDFRIDESGITADEVFRAQVDGSGHALDRAEKWLADQLATGPKTKQQLERDASAAGIHTRTLERAKGEIGAKTESLGRFSSWKL